MTKLHGWMVNGKPGQMTTVRKGLAQNEAVTYNDVDVVAALQHLLDFESFEEIFSPGAMMSDLPVAIEWHPETGLFAAGFDGVDVYRMANVAFFHIAVPDRFVYANRLEFVGKYNIPFDLNFERNASQLIKWSARGGGHITLKSKGWVQIWAANGKLDA